MGIIIIGKVIGLIAGIFLAFLPSDVGPPTTNRTIVVNSTDDLDDGTCDSTHCSLREAINLANTRPGPDLITFDPKVFPKSGSQVIYPTTELPYIRDDRTTLIADGAKVVIDGSTLALLGIEAYGLVIKESSDNTIRGIQIQNYPGIGALIASTNRGSSDNNTLLELKLTGNGFGFPPKYDGRVDAIVIYAFISTKDRSCGNRVLNCTIWDNADDGIALLAYDGAKVDSNIIAGNFVSNNAENGIEMEGVERGSRMSRNIVFNNIIKSHRFHHCLLLQSYDSGNCNETLILSNTILSGDKNGISITSSDAGSTTSGTVIVGNTVDNFLRNGLDISSRDGGETSHTLIKNNTFSDCGKEMNFDGEIYGIRVSSDNNLIYHNNFISNRDQGCDTGNNNLWYYNGEGNFWSDYQGQDNDANGIGDSEYSFWQVGVDRFPLMAKFSVNSPARPATLRAKSVSSTFVMLEWEDRSANEDGFEIQRRERIGKKWTWLIFSVKKADTTTCKDGAVFADTRYKYRVRAFNSAGFSRFSKTIRVRTNNLCRADRSGSPPLAEGCVSPDVLDFVLRTSFEQ